MNSPNPPILGFGASTMQGVGDSAGGFLTRLSLLLGSNEKPFPVTNHGKGGDTTRNMVGRLDRSTALLPATVVVLLGCNDVPRHGDKYPQKRTDLPTYTANLDRIFSTLSGPGAIFITSFMVNPATGVTPDFMDPYMAKALEIADTHRYRIWDLYEESKSFGDRFWAPDGIHYNDAGHQFIAERVRDLLNA